MSAKLSSSFSDSCLSSILPSGKVGNSGDTIFGTSLQFSKATTSSPDAFSSRDLGSGKSSLLMDPSDVSFTTCSNWCNDEVEWNQVWLSDFSVLKVSLELGDSIIGSDDGEGVLVVVNSLFAIFNPCLDHHVFASTLDISDEEVPVEVSDQLFSFAFVLNIYLSKGDSGGSLSPGVVVLSFILCFSGSELSLLGSKLLGFSSSTGSLSSSVGSGLSSISVFESLFLCSFLFIVFSLHL
jgi:hypothetical protein